jgi:hypothetical protein
VGASQKIRWAFLRGVAVRGGPVLTDRSDGATEVLLSAPEGARWIDASAGEI